MLLEDLTPDLIKKVIRTYIKFAYPQGISERDFGYKNTQNLLSANSVEDIFKIFQRVDTPYSSDLNGEKCSSCKFVAQLGSKDYPFMKLVLQQCDNTSQFGFLVDRHTEYLALQSKSQSFNQELKIKDYTRDLKLLIEEEFEKNQIPTYRVIIRELTKEKMEQKRKLDIKPKSIDIILVEDDLEIQELHKIELEMKGYNVRVADTGEKGMNLARNEYFDCMILDLMMPGISGFEVIEMVGQEIPIIVLTALSDSMSRKQCLDNGAKEMLTKPADMVELENLIDQYVTEDRKNKDNHHPK